MKMLVAEPRSKFRTSFCAQVTRRDEEPGYHSFYISVVCTLEDQSIFLKVCKNIEYIQHVKVTKTCAQVIRRDELKSQGTIHSTSLAIKPVL